MSAINFYRVARVRVSDFSWVLIFNILFRVSHRTSRHEIENMTGPSSPTPPSPSSTSTRFAGVWPTARVRRKNPVSILKNRPILSARDRFCSIHIYLFIYIFQTVWNSSRSEKFNWSPFYRSSLHAITVYVNSTPSYRTDGFRFWAKSVLDLLMICVFFFPRPRTTLFYQT